MNMSMNKNIIVQNQKETKKLFELGLKELAENHIDFAKNYFEKALLRGHEVAVRYYFLLSQKKDISLVRDIILCAEKPAEK